MAQGFQVEHFSVRARWLQNIIRDGMWLPHSDDKINRLMDLIGYPTQVAESHRSRYVDDVSLEDYDPILHTAPDLEIKDPTDLYLPLVPDIGLGEAQHRRLASFDENEIAWSYIPHQLKTPPQDKDSYRNALKNITIADIIVSCGCVAMFDKALSSYCLCWAPQLRYPVDAIGRKRMYELELMIVILGTFTLGLCLPPVSEAPIGYILPLRVLMAVGLCSDYPLTSVISREFATSRRRSTTRAAAFIMQGTREPAPYPVGATDIACTCIFALSTENIWCPIIGVIAIASCGAIYLRLAIPKSPHYSLDIYPDFDTAVELDKVYPAQRPEMRYIQAIVEMVAIYHFPEKNSMRRGSSPALVLPIPPLTAPLKVSIPHQSVRLPGLPRPPRLAFSNQIACFFGAATCWCLLDAAFYGIAFGNARIFHMIDHASDFKTWEVFGNRNAFNLILVRAFALESCGLAIGPLYFLGRRHIRISGFTMLTTLFIMNVSSTTHPLPIGSITALYIICQLFFTLGPNTIPFIIPNDIFPTRHYSTHNGIPIIIDKLTAIIAQVVFTTLCTIGAARDSKRYKFISRAMNICHDIQSHFRTGKYAFKMLHILCPMNQLRRWMRYQCVRLSVISDNFMSAITTTRAVFPSTGRVARLGMAI